MKMKRNSLIMLIFVMIALALTGCSDSSVTTTPTVTNLPQQTAATQPTVAIHATVTTQATVAIQVTPKPQLTGSVVTPTAKPTAGSVQATPTPPQETAPTDEETLPVIPGSKVLDVPTSVQSGLGGWTGSLLMDHPTYQTYTVDGDARQIVSFYTQKLAELDYLDAFELDSKVNGVTTHREDYAKKEFAVTLVIIGPLDEPTLNKLTGEYPELAGKVNAGSAILVVAKDRNPAA